MADEDRRLTELELRYMEQTDLIEQLNGELLSVNNQVQTLERRVLRLERQLEDALRGMDKPVVERPPHY